MKQGVRKSLERPGHWQVGSSHWLPPLLRAGGAYPPQVHGEVYGAQCVCAALDIFTNCSVVVFISFIPAVAQGIFGQPEPLSQLGLAR